MDGTPPSSPPTAESESAVPSAARPQANPPARPAGLKRAGVTDPQSPSPSLPPHRQGPRTLAELLRDTPDSSSVWVPELPRVEVDEARASAAGIDKVSGPRLVLYTDVPIDEQIADQRHVDRSDR